MLYIIALLIFTFSSIKFRLAVLALPIVPMFFSKGFLFLDSTSAPPISFYKIYCLSIILSWFLNRLVIKDLKFQRSTIFVATKVIILLFLYLVVLIANPESFNDSLKIFITFVIEIFLPTIIFVDVVSKINNIEFEKFCKTLIFIVLCIACYAIIAYLINYNPYIEFVESTIKTNRVIVHTYEDTLRGLRAQGTVSHPITFGALLVLSLPLISTLYSRKSINIIQYVFISSVIFLAILLTNSRTPLIFFMLYFITLSLFLPASKKIKLIFFLGFIISVSLMTSDFVYSKFLSIINIFDSQVGEEMHGSTLQMRFLQFKTAWNYYLESPIFGNGLAFSRNLIKGGIEQNLFNMEGLVLIILVDLGLIGLLGFVAFFAGMFFMPLRKFTNINIEAAQSLKALTLPYVIFVCATGWVDSLQSFMFWYSTVYFLSTNNNLNNSKRRKLDVGG
jgi:hypothetical protein